MPKPLKSILLVDDYPAGLMVSTMIIEDLGYSVVGISSGEEAIEQVQASHSAFIAILMDVNMKGMDGFETTKAIRAVEQGKTYTNTIIAVTAHALAGDCERCLEAGMDDYISKPIHPDLLARKLVAKA